MDGALILFLLSAGFVIAGVILWQKSNHLVNYGKRTSAVVFKNNFHPGKQGGFYHPVVRFLTDNQVWVTQELSIGFNPPMDEGMEVDVIYDPDDPTNVMMGSTFPLIILPRLLVAIGIVGCIAGAMEYLGYLSFLNN